MYKLRITITLIPLAGKVKLVIFLFKQHLTFYNRRLIFSSFPSGYWGLYIKSHSSQRNSEEQMRKNLVKVLWNHKNTNVGCIFFSIIHYLHLVLSHPNHGHSLLLFIPLLLSCCLFQSLSIVIHSTECPNDLTFWQSSDRVKLDSSILYTHPALTMYRDCARHWKSKDIFKIRSLLLVF